MNALLRKEIRDAVRWLPLGLVLSGLLLAYSWLNMNPTQLSSQLFTVTWFSALLYGTFLSLVTSLPDEREAARAFLIQRAISPNQIFRTRVLVGIAIYSLGMFIPLAVLAIYLATLGTHRLPVTPWQVLPAFAVAVTGSIFYFAGIAVACRPAHWFGTRLLPIPVAIGGSFLSIVVLAGAPLYISLPVYALSCVFVLLMALAARHAFVRMPSQVSPIQVRTESMAMRFILLSSSILFVSAAGLLPINFVTHSIFRYPTTEFDKNGIPFYVVRSSALNRDGSLNVIESIPMIGPSEPKPDQIEITEFGTPFMLGNFVDRANKFDPTLVQALGDRQIFFDPAGYMLVYQSTQMFGYRLECVIASDSVTLSNEPRGTSFQKIPRPLQVSHFSPPTNFSFDLPHSTSLPMQDSNVWSFVTSDGVLKVDLEKRSVELLLKESIDSFGLAMTGDSERIAIQSGDSMKVYKSDATKPGVQPTRFTLESTLGADASAGGLLCYRDKDNWTYLNGYATQRKFDITRCMAGNTRKYEFAVPYETLKSMGRVQSETRFVFGVLPPLLTVGALTVTQTFSDFTAIDYLPLLIQLSLTIAITLLATRYRGLNTRQTALWIVLAALLGYGVSLAVIAIYPVAVYEICGACQRRRRVENASCEHCGAEWDALPSEGIEIAESGAIESLATVGQA